MNIALANRRAIGWFFVGLLSTTVLVNVAAFLSPVWAELRYGAEAASAHKDEFQEIARKAAVWFSIFFIFGALEVSRTFNSLLARSALIAVAVATISWPIFHLVAPPDRPNPLLDTFVRGAAYVAFLVCVWRVWKTIPVGTSAGRQ